MSLYVEVPQADGTTVTWTMPYTYDEAEARRFANAMRAEYGDATVLRDTREVVK